MGIQVFCRYVLNFSLSWSEELTRYMFIWSCFISISYCIKRWISIKVDQVINMFPKKLMYCTIIVKYIVICTLLLFEYSWIQILMLSIASKQTSPALQLPMPYVQCAPFVGFVLATIRSFQQIICEVENVKRMLNNEKIIDQDPREGR